MKLSKTSVCCADVIFESSAPEPSSSVRWPLVGAIVASSPVNGAIFTKTRRLATLLPLSELRIFGK